MTGPPKTRKRAVGLVVSPRWVLTSWGATSLAETPREVALYAYDSTGLMPDATRGPAAAHYFNGRITAYTFGARRVRVLGDVFDTDPAGAYAALDEWAEWVHGLGGSVGSFAGSSLSIYKACARRETFFASERRAQVPRGLLLGSRQESTPGIYSGLDAWDVPTAYPATLGALWVPRKYRRYARVAPGDGAIGFAQASVSVPRLDYGPLPVPLGRAGVVFPTGERIEGAWDLSELRLAAELGCRVKTSEATVGLGLAPTFRAWRAAVATGAGLRTPDARALAKSTGVSLWGFFAAQGRSTVVSWDLAGRESIKRTAPRTAPAYGIAAHVAAAMRVRLYREALVRAPVVAHTDGAIMVGEPAGPGWRHEGRLARLEVLDAQHYRYVDEDGEVGYCLAGVPRENAPEVWERRFRELLVELGILELRSRSFSTDDARRSRPLDDSEEISPAVLALRKSPPSPQLQLG